MYTHSLLELHLHLVNGRVHKFAQDDPDLVQDLLKQVSSKVFLRPSLIIHSANQACVYQGASLAGISVIMDPLPGELLTLDTLSANIWEITEAEYHERRQSMLPPAINEPYILVSEIEMRSGERLWTEQQIPRSLGGLNERATLHHAFSLPSLVCRRHGGGISIWNRSQMMSLSFSPKLDVPISSWPADPAATSFPLNQGVEDIGSMTPKKPANYEPVRLRGIDTTAYGALR